jgi:CubicO group peptidase (beta-lactamase class C family)
MQSVPGGTHWGGGMSISSVDQALIGQMLLNGGRVGARQVLSQAWVRSMHAPCDIANWYGMLVWLNTQSGICKGASETSYFCIGAGASFVWIDPAHDLVAVVRWIEGSRINGFCELVTKALIK